VAGAAFSIRIPSVKYLLPILLICSATQTRQPIPPPPPSLERELESLAPRAQGIAQVEVTDVHFENHTASDGSAYQEVGFRILRSSGATRDKIQIVTEPGGYLPDEPPVHHFEPLCQVRVGDFKKRSRYWIAFSSQYDSTRYPQDLVAWWPDDRAPKVLEEAVRTDHYADKPQYDPTSGLTHGYRVDEKNGVWRVWMKRGAELLWQVELPGRRYEGRGGPEASAKYPGEWHLTRRQWSKELPYWTSSLEHADANASGWHLLAEGLCPLADSNSYGLPAGDHRVTWALDADTGRTAAIFVSNRLDLGPMATPPGVVQYFDAKSGRVKREERIDWMPTGSLNAGGYDPGFLRKIVRTLDPATGEVKDEKTYRCDRSEFVLVGK
jgi:hypothetical protein